MGWGFRRSSTPETTRTTPSVDGPSPSIFPILGPAVNYFDRSEELQVPGPGPNRRNARSRARAVHSRTFDHILYKCQLKKGCREADLAGEDRPAAGPGGRSQDPAPDQRPRPAAAGLSAARGWWMIQGWPRRIEPYRASGRVRTARPRRDDAMPGGVLGELFVVQAARRRFPPGTSDHHVHPRTMVGACRAAAGERRPNRVDRPVLDGQSQGGCQAG